MKTSMKTAMSAKVRVFELCERFKDNCPLIRVNGFGPGAWNGGYEAVCTLEHFVKCYPEEYMKVQEVIRSEAKRGEF